MWRRVCGRGYVEEGMWRRECGGGYVEEGMWREGMWRRVCGGGHVEEGNKWACASASVVHMAPLIHRLVCELYVFA